MSKTTETDIAFIRALAQILREHDLVEIEVEREFADDDELKVRLSRAPAVPTEAHAPLAAAPLQAVDARAPVAAPSAPAEECISEEPVTSPMVGTVYLAAEPDAAPFVKVGDTVAEGETILIIEAMKTMNQIPSPVSGTVRVVMVANAEPVEYGAPLMVIA